MKIVINKCYGGFSISKEAGLYMASRGSAQAQSELYSSLGYNWFGYGYSTDKFPIQYSRTDPLLVEAVEKLGSDKASGSSAKLKVVEIPDDVDWEIDEYDGMEKVIEVRREWG